MATFYRGETQAKFATFSDSTEPDAG